MQVTRPFSKGGDAFTDKYALFKGTAPQNGRTIDSKKYDPTEVFNANARIYSSGGDGGGESLVPTLDPEHFSQMQPLIAPVAVWDWNQLI